jgi:2-oxoisovalerate dehydrogenase E1 component
VIDARSLVPFNYDVVIESIKRTGRIVIAGDATGRGSFMRDLASNLTELAFDYLDAPPVVVGSRNWITPAYELEEAFFPQASWIIDAIHERILPLDGHNVNHDFSEAEQLDRNARGI